MKKATMVASCARITTREALEKWVDKLPAIFSPEVMEELMERAKYKSHVTWTRRGLRVW